MSYADLLKDLADVEDMQKSLTSKKAEKGASDKKIQSASDTESENEEEGGNEGEEQNEEGENESEEEGGKAAPKIIAKSTKKPAPNTSNKKAKAEEQQKEEEPMEKSFILTTEDGTEVELVDKAVMLKAFASTTSIMKSMTSQIDSLNKRVEELSSKGSGRKTVIAVTEKSGGGMHKSQPTGVTSEEFFSKAFAAQKAGRINSIDISTAEAYLAKGIPIPNALIQRVMASE